MVAPVPWPGSCSSEVSCLMVVNTNCSVDAERGSGERKQHTYTHKTASQYTHTVPSTAHLCINDYVVNVFVMCLSQEALTVEMRLMPAHDGCKPEQLLT